jgi:hypothetical protein
VHVFLPENKTPANIITTGPCPSPTFDGFIKTRLKSAEKEWKQKKIAREASEKTYGVPGTSEHNGWLNGMMIWDYMYPTFDCPYLLQRLGRVGDGGKWVCGLKQVSERPKCLIYSFGVNTEVSFEKEVLSRANNCRIRMFDPTIQIERVPLSLEDYGGRANFTELGLAGSDRGKVRTLKTLMAMHGDNFIDILKVDIEGAEILSLARAVSDFPESLPFGQIQVEVHAPAFEGLEAGGLNFTSWRNMLEGMGLRVFHTEPNLTGKSKLYVEFAMLNIKSEMFKV